MKKHITIISIALSTIAVVLSLYVNYVKVFKPFELLIRIDPVVRIHPDHGCFAIHLDIDFFNDSPKTGLITKACVMLCNTGNMEDSYLLPLMSFMVVGEDGIYISSQEKLPLLFQSHQRRSKTMKFVYDTSDEQFPISMAIYECKLLIWVDDAEYPEYSNDFRFEITSSTLKLYNTIEAENLQDLVEINRVGFIPLKAHRLTKNEKAQFR
jgi:hypothetical protein